MIDASEYLQNLEKKSFLVFGLGKSSTAVVKVLKKAGATLYAGDDSEDVTEEFIKKHDVKAYDPETQDWSGIHALILSPGVPLTDPEPHDVVKAAQEAGVDVICDIELFFRIAPKCTTIGVTGTNGKSTTASLTHHLLEKCGKNSVLAGNIGHPIFALNKPKKDQVIVVELSSFQIDLMPRFRPDISVLTNITPDHLDRHGTIENYADVKARIFEPLADHEKFYGVICTDDEYGRKIYDKAKDTDREIIEVSTLKALSNGVYVQEDHLCEAKTGQDVLDVGDISGIPALKGVHNHQNAACAYAAVRFLDVSSADIFGAMQSFPGLEHRQFLTRTINGVAYVNDSKATNAGASAMALGCRNNIYWIVGGRKKKTGLEGLEPYFKRVKHAFLIGESMDEFADWLDNHGVDYSRSMTMENAVVAAHEMAQENRGQPGGGVVLLSPACASFDQFSSFEDRGDVFTKLVQDLPEENV